ncbi:MAG: hypothetical protein K2G05_05240, partial [Duncaniella sp.]|nr:hypothetical protein [Duncaniella sp.]
MKAPDFAYPQTVSEDARRNLDKALREDNPREVLHSLIDYTLARSSTDAANVPGCISLIDSVRHVSRNDVLPGMLSMLEAVIYNNVYTSARWKYDARTSLPQSPLPADYTEWSGEQFRHRITELIGCALADSVALRSVPLKAYDGVVTQDRMTSVYYPTLYNFVARQAIDIMQGFGGMVRPALMRDSIGDRILAIYASVIDDAPRGSAPEVNARLERLMYSEHNSPYMIVLSSRRGLDESLMELYRSYLTADGHPMTEYAGDILLAMPVYDSARRMLYDTMSGFLTACPGYWRKDCIRQTLRTMEHKSVSVNAPHVVAPGGNTDFKVVLTNVDRLTVDIYDVSSAPVDIDNFTFTTGMAGVCRVASLPVEVKGERVPFEVTRTVTYTFDKPGNYIAVP